MLAIDHESGRVVGGARLLPTTNNVYSCAVSIDPTTYMINDAYHGRLEGLPANICNTAPPVDEHIWELSRYVSVSGYSVGALVWQAANNFLLSKGAKSCLCLGSPAFLRVARKLNAETRPLGKIIDNGEAKFLAFSVDLIPGEPLLDTTPSTHHHTQGPGIPVATLVAYSGEFLGLVYRWNSGEEEISWNVDHTYDLRPKPDFVRLPISHTR